MDAAVPEPSTGRAGAVVLVSGGLDSAIALEMLVEQGVPVTALHFVSVFSPGRDPKGRLAARTITEQSGVPLLVRDATKALLEIVPNPRFGWGKHVNPCMDCHAYQMSEAKALFAELGASFVATGEVLGQRPMSQNLGALGRVEKAAGLEGLVLRPLSARCLEPTVPEQKGWVDRERLLAIKGRSRAEQNLIAKERGITGFTTPAGGCLLTDAQFAWKLQDLLNWDGRLAANDAHLLKLGRHFRPGPQTRAIVGRNERENAKIVALRRPGDWILVAAAGGSPETLLRGEATPAHLETAARLTAAYSRQRTENEVAVDATPGAVGFAGETLAEAKRLTVAPADGEMIRTLGIRRPGGDADGPARSGRRL
jgi:tRNA U34 2-thiouridine synthase MnmA/TrmU